MNFPPMRALELIRDHVTFKLPYDFSYHMKTPNENTIAHINENKSMVHICNNISSVMEFQLWWVLKSKHFGQESTCQGFFFLNFLRVMTVCQKVQKSYFQSQNSTAFFFHLRISI